MIPLPSAGSAAVQLLHQAASQPSAQGQNSGVLALPSPRDADGDDTWATNTMDITASKVRLMERLGEVFGIAMEDHADARGFAEAIRAVVDTLRTTTDGLKLIASVSRDLGLDDLGVSVDTLIAAIVDPAGGEAETLDAALRERVGDVAESMQDARILEKLARMGLDEAGLYGR